MSWFNKKATLPPQSTKSADEVSEQLGLLRELTKTTGMLHEAQRLQLDNWIRVALDKAVDHSIILELSSAYRVVTFDVTIKGKQKDTDIRLKYLDEWVKWLLGPDVTVRVKINGDLAWEQGPKLLK